MGGSLPGVKEWYNLSMSQTRQTTADSRRRPGRWGRLMIGAVLATWLPSVFLAVVHAEQTASSPEAPSAWLQWMLAFAFGRVQTAGEVGPSPGASAARGRTCCSRLFSSSEDVSSP